MRCPVSWGTYLGYVGVSFCRWVFPTLKTGLLLSMEISYHVHSILPNLSENGSEGLEWSWSPPYSLCPLLNLIPSFELCLPLEARTRTFAPEKRSSYLHIAPFSSHILFFLTTCYYHNPWLLLPTILGLLQDCPAVSVFETCTLAPYLLGFCRHAASVNTLPEKPCDFHLSWLPFRCNLMIWLNSNIFSTWEGHLQEEERLHGRNDLVEQVHFFCMEQKEDVCPRQAAPLTCESSELALKSSILMHKGNNEQIFCRTIWCY